MLLDQPDVLLKGAAVESLAFGNLLRALGKRFRQVTARQVEAEALVGLFRALGGGWPLKQNLPEIPKPEPAVAAAVKYLMNPEQGPLNPTGNPSASRP